MVHVAVDHWVVHGVGHGQPVDHQVYLLDIVAVVYLRIDVRRDEVGVIRKPADNEYQDYHHHHLHNLERKL